MTCREDEPNGLAMPRPVHSDPWPEEDPVVRYYETDTRRERQAARALEAATRRALSDPRAP